MGYISRSTSDHYGKFLQERDSILKESLLEVNSECLLEDGMRDRNILLETSFRNNVYEILNNEIITEKNIELLRKEKGIGYEYKVEIFDGKGEKKGEEVLKVGGLYSLEKNIVSYESPVGKELFSILEKDLDFEEGDVSDLELTFSFDNGISYKVLEVKRTDEIL